MDDQEIRPRDLEVIRRTPFTNFVRKYSSPKNIGWLLLSIFILILIGGGIRTIFKPDANYFDPIIGIMNFFLGIGGTDLDTVDYRLPLIFRGLATGALLTLSISMIAVIIGFFFATLLAIILVNRSRIWYVLIFKFIAQIYVDFFRSTPLLVQILLVYFGMPRAIVLAIRGLDWAFLSAEIFAGALALILNTSAYQAEIIRSGILAIPAGQTEAARGLGMTSRQTMRYVILPQAVRIIVPPLTNELINVILNSSLLSAIGVLELTKRSQSLQSRYFMPQIFFIAAIYYFIIAYSLSKITKQLEVKLHIPGLGVSND